jgi:hypothetical protein
MATLLVFVLVAVGGGGYYLWHRAADIAAIAKAPTAVAAPPTASSSVAPVVPPPVTNAKTTASGWDDGTVHPVTPPVAVAGHLVVYTADQGALTIRAFDAATGATLWSFPASPGDGTIGEPFEVAHDAASVYFLQQVEGAVVVLAKLVAVDVATGKVRWTTAQVYDFADMPELCAGGTFVCAGTYGANGEFSAVSVDVTNGAVTTDDAVGGRRIGPGLVDPGGRKPEFLERVDAATGTVVWKDNVATLAKSPVSSDDGWNWDLYGDVYVGWFGAIADPSSHTVSFAGEQTIGVRASDGVELWRRPGLYGCPIQGILDDGSPVAVRCVVGGTLTLDANGENPVTKGLNVTVQGFDVHTGLTTWSRNLGNAPAAIGLPGTAPMRVGPHTFFLGKINGAMSTLDLKTGAVAPLGSAAGWCVQDDVTFTLTGFTLKDGTDAPYATEGLVESCTAGGLAGPGFDGSADSVGVSSSGYFVWSSKDGLHAFKLP